MNDEKYLTIWGWSNSRKSWAYTKKQTSVININEQTIDIFRSRWKLHLHRKPCDDLKNISSYIKVMLNSRKTKRTTTTKPLQELSASVMASWLATQFVSRRRYFHSSWIEPYTPYHTFHDRFLQEYKNQLPDKSNQRKKNQYQTREQTK